MASPRLFADRIYLIGKNIPEKVNAIKIAAAAAIDQVVVIATPVDTGRARANWQVGLEQARRIPLEEFDKAGQATIAKGQGKIRASKLPQVIYISNNVPYINRLNEGWSAQAPANFVHNSILAGIQQVRSAMRNVGITKL